MASAVATKLRALHASERQRAEPVFHVRTRERAGAAPGTRRRSAEIVDAAARVFARLGYHGTTTTDIAGELGIRQGSLYYYFPSKEAALEAVVLRGVEGHVVAARAITGSDAAPTEKLNRLVVAHLQPIVERSDYVRVFLKERHHLPAVSRRRIGRQSRMIERTFESIIAAGVASGEFRSDVDPRLATLAILGMCNAVPDWWRGEGKSMDAICATFTALVIAGLVTPAAVAGGRAR